MARHAIPFPPHTNPFSGPSFLIAEVTVVGDRGPQQLLQVKTPNYETLHGDADNRLSSMPALIPGAYQMSNELIGLSKPSSEVFCSQNLRTASAANLQSPSLDYGDIRQIHDPRFIQMGVDFVLSLIHTRSSDLEEPSGHALSMQGILLSAAPEDLQNETTWEVPAQQPDRLFELSGCLGLDRYITPVQAWNQISHRVDVIQLALEELERLRSAMVPHTKCYGFGSLIEEDFFEQLLSSSGIIQVQSSQEQE